MGRVLIGLTGTFGSGKSTVAAMFAECGAAIIDADAIAHKVVEPGQPALQEIKETFGENYILPNGRMNRKEMADTVFVSPQKRKILEGIIHPRVREEMTRRIEELQETYRSTGKPEVIILDIPLLFESNMAHMTHKTVVVTVSEAQRFHRVRTRDNLDESQVVRRLASQMAQRDKAARADYVVDNSGSIQETRKQVHQLYAQWLKNSENSLPS